MSLKIGGPKQPEGPGQVTSLYGGDVEMKFEPRKHKYFVREKDILGLWGEWQVKPSVTTLLGVLDKPALVQWAANMAVDFIQENLKVGEALDEITIGDLCSNARSAHRKYTKKACDVGTLVHQRLAEFLESGEVRSPVNEQAKSGFDAGIEWLQKHNAKALVVEGRAYSREFGFTATTDFIGEVDGINAVLDFKTSKDLYENYYWQIAAYAQARYEMAGEWYEGWLLRIDKETGEFEAKRVPKEDLQEYAKAFVHLIPIWEAQRKFKEQRKAEGYTVWE